MALSRQEVKQIAAATADEVMERMREQLEIRDIVIGCAIGEGAIPLYGRETRKEPCAGCRIDPTKPLEAGNVMATTNGAIGTLSRDEVRRWCSEIIEVADGRCARARAIRTAAKECKEKHPQDTEAFFKCYIPAFSQATTRGGNPGAKEPWQMTLAEYYKSARQWRAEYMPRLTGRTLELELEQVAAGHKRIVQNAIGLGKPVPPEVLADYPDLQKESNPTTEFPPEVQSIIDKWRETISEGGELIESDARKEIIRAAGYKGGVGETDRAIRAIKLKGPEESGSLKKETIKCDYPECTKWAQYYGRQGNIKRYLCVPHFKEVYNVPDR